MSVEESPPPYSAVVATPRLLESPSEALPFSHSDRLATEIRALVSEGNILCSRFKHFHEVASADVRFEYEIPAFILSQKFEALTWESRNMAGIALVAVKDFNEIILDFLSEPNATIQDRVKELSNASNLLKRDRGSAASHKSSFDSFIQELEDYSRMIHFDSGALIRTRRRQNFADERGIRSARPPWQFNPPYLVPRPVEPMSGFSMITASFGMFSRTCADYTLHFERIAEQALFSWYIDSPPKTPAAIHGQAAPDHSQSAKPAERRIYSSISPGHAEPPDLSGLVDTLLHDVCTFASRADVFNTVLVELAREQDIFIVYLKDGQSVANQPYRSEVLRVRRHLPRVCSALDTYSKAKLS